MSKTLLSLSVSLCLTPAGLFAGTLTSVPMQGGMVMPMISYQSDGRLHVMLDPVVPQLTPLLVSNPLDDFDPVDPWYDHLSPARQGLSFSRRYGFVMDANTELLPPGTEMWIRKLSSSPGLKAYRYGTGEAQFEPIFGTDGVSNNLRWNGMMFHPAFTAPSGTNAHTATFEVYLVDSGTGAEIPNSTTGEFTLQWSNVPDGRPELRIGRDVVSWPGSATNYVLESTFEIESGAWTAVAEEPVVREGRASVPIVAWSNGQRRFFRMRIAP